MNIVEMSTTFDVLYNQVNSNQASSLDEYEKSLFLTRAQDDLIKAYFDPKGNKFIDGFDGSEKRQYDFSLLIENTTLMVTDLAVPYDLRGYTYKMPEDILLVLNESIIESAGVNKSDIVYQILPISYAEYFRQMQKPYPYPPKRVVWRLITSSLNSSGSAYSNPNDVANPTQNSVCEIIGRFVNNSSSQLTYRMRYVKKPYPIILVNLNTNYNGLSIDGYYGDISLSTESNIADANGGIPCYLPDGIHHEIVQRAVELATAVYNPQALNAITGIGNVSSTNLGIIPRQESK